MHRFGLIGKDISYSFSPGYFGEKFRKLGLEDYTYQIFDLADISEFPALFGEYPDLKGLNVTIPYKQVVMPFLDHIAPEAAWIGAVNTICLQGSITTGHNTDVTGFRESLRPLLLPADREALILGTGGASRAVAHALEQLGIRFRYVSRNPGPGQLSYTGLDAPTLRKVQIVVNTTPLGTHPNTDARPEIPYEALGPEHLLFDLIYNPGQTAFLSEGRSRGSRIKNGLEMLEIQAEHAWKLWNAPAATPGN
ncbi:shikimate dehydrogenase family protein [Robiginitalea biformata]|uniref:shikimate dehydrogenase family protein n=1 Tax=Robiginitalea biformata TaxID=252307 RepID=UPI003B5CB8CD